MMKVLYVGLRWPLCYGKLNDAGDIGGFLDLVEEFLLFDQEARARFSPSRSTAVNTVSKLSLSLKNHIYRIGENDQKILSMP